MLGKKSGFGLFCLIWFLGAVLLCASVCAKSLAIDQDPSDYTYFHSQHIINSTQSYKNTEFNVKTGNAFVAERLDYTNPQKGNRIILTKNNNDSVYSDVFFQTNLKKRVECLPDNAYHYSYFYLEGEFLFENSTLNWQLAMLRDTSDGSNREAVLCVNKGNLIFQSGGDTIPLATLTPQKWYHILALYNTKTHTADFYLDGQSLKINAPFSGNVNNLSIIRCNLLGGVGSAMVRNWEFTGLAKPYGKTLIDGGYRPVISRSSLFPDDTAVKTFLADKTVFHGEGNLYYKNGVKRPFLHPAQHTDSELFISLTDFNAAMGINAQYVPSSQALTVGASEYFLPISPYIWEDVVYVPVHTFLSELWCISRFSFYGKMVIVSPQDDIVDCTYRESWFDEQYYAEGGNYPTLNFSDIEEISNYVFFDRPLADDLKSAFDSHIGAAHPRLLIGGDDVTTMRKRMKTDLGFAYMAKAFLKKADGYLDSSVPKYLFDDVMRTKGNAERILNKDLALAFAYILTGDTKYSDKVISDLMVMSDFPDLNAAHIIDTGVWLRGLSISYDWCYDAMTEEQRQTVSDFILEKGVRVLQRAYYAMLPSGGAGGFQQANWFPRWKSNYIAFVQGGLVPACLAVAEKDPDLCFDTLEKTFRSWEYMLYGFYDQGVWLEGKSYANILYSYLSSAMASVVKCLGGDYNILQYPAFKNSFTASMSCTSLTASFSFADDSIRSALGNVEPSWAFYADYYDDDMIRAARALAGPTGFKTRYLGKNGGVDMMDMIFYNADPAVEAVQELPRVMTASGADIFSLHEDWMDKNALFFASSAGVSRHYHQHNDSGDFIFCLDGEMWTYELGSGNYNVGNIYTRYSGRTEAHNTLTINPDSGFSQQERAFAPLIACGEGEGAAYAVYDMTDLYSQHGASNITRGFYIGDGYDSLTVRDEMTFDSAATGYWFMNTPAGMEQIDAHTIRLTQNGKTLYATFTCEGGTGGEVMQIMDAAPLPASPSLEGDTSAQTGIKKIAIYFQGAGDIAMTVRLAPVLSAPDTAPIALWGDKIANEIYEAPSEGDPGDERLLWQCDFEDYEDGDEAIWAVSKGSGVDTAVEVVGTDDNKYLSVHSQRQSVSTAAVACSLFIDGGADPQKPLTAEYDLRLAPYNRETMLGYDGDVLKYTEYNMGISNSINHTGVYFTANPYFDGSDVYSNSGVSIFGTRLAASYYSTAAEINWYDWNRFRWTLTQDENGKACADVYVNGRYFSRVGIREENGDIKGLFLSMIFNRGISEGGFYLDNIAFYEGRCAPQEYSLKTLNDTVTVFSKDFEELAADAVFQEQDTVYPYYMMRNAVNGSAVLSGTAAAEQNAPGRSGGNVSLRLSGGAFLVFPTAFKTAKNETTLLSFDAALSEGDALSVTIGSGDSALPLIGIDEQGIGFGGKVFLYPFGTQAWRQVRIVCGEYSPDGFYASLYIDGEEIAYRKLIDDACITADMAPEQAYLDLNLSGDGYVDNIASRLYRGNVSRPVSGSEISIAPKEAGSALVTLAKAGWDCADSPAIYLARYDKDEKRLNAVERLAVSDLGETYAAEMPYVYREDETARLLVLDGDSLAPLLPSRTVYYERGALN